jgi:hypothetical protein
VLSSAQRGGVEFLPSVTAPFSGLVLLRAHRTAGVSGEHPVLLDEKLR